MWSDLSLTRLREIARHYNKTVKIAGIAKLKKEEVIKELDKHLVLATDNKSVKHRTDKSDIMLLKEGEPKITAEYKATGKGKEYSKEDPKKAVKAELADLERKSADKKRIKAQAEGAKKDKEAIKPPTVAEATDFVIKKKKKATLPPRKEKAMTEEEAKAELKKLQDAKKKEIPVPPVTPKSALEDLSYKKKVVAKKVVQARGASADAMAIKPPEMKKEETSKISKELEQLKQDLMSDKADEKAKNSGNTLVLDYEYKLIDMGYEDKYKNKTPAEELMRKTLLEYIKLTAPQRRANWEARSYKANGDGYYMYVNMSKKEKEDILKNEKNIDFKKYYKEAKDRVESGDLLNKNTLPQELTSKILKEATQNTKRSNKWADFYRESKYTRGDNLVELMNKTLDRYFTAKYKNLKETGDLKIYLDNQKSMVLESGILPPSIATELNEKFKDANSQLDQSREVDLDGDKFTSYKNVKEKNSDIRSINKKILSNFKNLNKLKLLKEK